MISLVKVNKVYDLMIELSSLGEEEMQILAQGLVEYHRNKADSLQFSLETAFSEEAGYSV